MKLKRNTLKVKVLYWSHIVYSEMCSLYLTRPWGAVSSHSAVPGDQLQTGDTSNVHALMVGETRAPGENTRRHRENMQTPHRKALPQPGMEPRTFLLWGISVNHYSTMLPSLHGHSRSWGTHFLSGVITAAPHWHFSALVSSVPPRLFCYHSYKITDSARSCFWCLQIIFS